MFARSDKLHVDVLRGPLSAHNAGLHVHLRSDEDLHCTARFGLGRTACFGRHVRLANGKRSGRGREVSAIYLL